MSLPFLGEIRLYAGSTEPSRDWAICDGRLLNIPDYPDLFNVLGTTYGGDGDNTFAVPDLRGRVPVHVGPGFWQGNKGGLEQVALSPAQLPTHNHQPVQAAKTNAGSSIPTGAFWAASPAYTEYAAASDGTTMAPGALATAGGNLAHDNMSPFLAINFIIALQGRFPS